MESYILKGSGLSKPEKKRKKIRQTNLTIFYERDETNISDENSQMESD